SLLVWAVVLGPLGALLALPATLFVKALVVDADPRARWLNALIASNPRTSAEEPVLAERVTEQPRPSVAPAEVDISSERATQEPASLEATAQETATQETATEEQAAGENEVSLSGETVPGEPVVDDEAVAAEPVAAEPDDRPRRARLDEAPFVDDEAPVDDFPVFQKSATPYWPGAMSHAED
ncbi:MAG: hypothetical protein ACYC1E_17580, partial [Propionibacteriaceae bacterium]